MEELPEALDPAAWRPDDLARSEAWCHTFTGHESAEILALARETERTEELSVSPSLPILAPAVAKTAHELKSGLGFRILRGLQVQELGEQGAAEAFKVLSRLLGEPRPQPGGVKLVHVRTPQDTGNGQFGFRTTAELPFHADLEDVIGFLCVRPASQGGTRKFASAAAVYNVMRKECPRVLRVLTQPFHMALQRPHPSHGRKWTLLPFLSVKDGLFNACAYRIHIKQAQGLLGVPELTPAQHQALAVFNDVADHLSVSMDLKPGDIEYFNNHVVLHTRTQFSLDDKGPGRHLLRVWLSMTGFRDLDPEHPISLRARMRRSAQGV